MENLSLETTEWPANYLNLYNDMLMQINTNQSSNISQTVETAKANVSIVKLSISKLKEAFNRDATSSREEEILFFKHIKPLFHRQVIFWLYVYRLKTFQPLGGIDKTKTYFENETDLLNAFFKANVDFYAYYRTGQIYLDEMYFLRHTQDSSIFNPHSVDNDRSFSTSHDYLVSQILANELAQDYLNMELRKLDHNYVVPRVDKPIDTLKWTASKAGLVELLYALQSVGAFNNGIVELKQIAQLSESTFQLELGNYYHTFNELRLRKKNRTQLLDQMKDRLLKKMDEMDERA